ncbi:DUF2381 family protein [Archangium violaceum]|uniref:DUF2381 family protein n=1 Tax=Archangium violaceum TaxID=83451 RepID=UPI00194F839E|nr:DUF2381 family protein [Archangium violaceum]QRN97456.1 DUF2381 family protein [Archangium violaceum]
MLLLSPGAFLALVLLAGAAEAAEPPLHPHCAAKPRIDLVADSMEQAPEVCVSPDEPTTLVFDSHLAPRAVEFQPEGRLADWAQGQEDRSVLVIPKENYLPGERIKVTVRFADGAAPASASFWLVGHAARGARRVEVFRQPHPADALKKEATEAQAEARQCQEDKARLLVERKEPGGLMGAAWLERRGAVVSKDIWLDLNHHPANALWTERARSYSHEGRLAVRLGLSNPGTESWRAEGAVLKDTTGAEIALSVWQELAVDSGTTGLVVVGAEKPADQLSCPCTLKLWEEQGPRTVTVGNVTFPVSQKAGP